MLLFPPEIIASTRSSHPRDHITTTRPSEEGCAGCLLGMLRAARRNTADGLCNGLRMTLLFLLPRRYIATFDKLYHTGIVGNAAGSGFDTGAATPYDYGYVSSPMSELSTCNDCSVSAGAQQPYHNHPLPHIPPLPVSHSAHQGSFRSTPASSNTGADGTQFVYFSFGYLTSVDASSASSGSGISSPVLDPSHSHFGTGCTTAASASSNSASVHMGSRSSSFTGSMRMAAASSSGSSSSCCSPEATSDGSRSSPAPSICYTPCSSMSPSEGLSPAPSDDPSPSPISTTTRAAIVYKPEAVEGHPSTPMMPMIPAKMKYSTVGRDLNLVAADAAATDAVSPPVVVRTGGLGGFFSRGGSYAELAYSYSSRIAEVDEAQHDQREDVAGESVPLLSAQPLVKSG